MVCGPRSKKTARPVRLVIYPYVNDHLKESEALTSGANCHAAIICNASYADLQFLEDTQLPIPVVLYNRVCNGYCSVNVDDLKMGCSGGAGLLRIRDARRRQF